MHIFTFFVVALGTCLFLCDKSHAQEMTGTSDVGQTQAPPTKSPEQLFQEAIRFNTNGLTCGESNATILQITDVGVLSKADNLVVKSVATVTMPFKDQEIVVNSLYRVNLLGVKSPNPKNVETSDKGQEAVLFAKEWLTSRKDKLFALAFRDSNNKILAHVCETGTGECLNKSLVVAGFAKPFCGKK